MRATKDLPKGFVTVDTGPYSRLFGWAFAAAFETELTKRASGGGGAKALSVPPPPGGHRARVRRAPRGGGGGRRAAVLRVERSRVERCLTDASRPLNGAPHLRGGHPAG